MTKPTDTMPTLKLACRLLAATVVLCGTQQVSAQDPAPEPLAAPSDAAQAEISAPAGDLAAQVTALRAEVDALKTKQEEAETAALLADPGMDTSSTEPEALRVYGFMDFGFDKFFMGPESGFAWVRPTRAGSFVFGNLNLYFDAAPVEHLRVLAEVRLTLAPHGEETSIATSYERINTTAFDFSSPTSQVQLRLGGLFIERAYSEYEFSKAFRVQWGLFLNPFGIWNLDHGSPTLISLMLPTFISAQMVPTRLLGLHAYGSFFVGKSELAYAIHVTNGRTPIDFDFSEDKAVGARAYWAYESDFGRLVLGASGYAGTYRDQMRKFNFSKPGMTSIDEVTTVDYAEQVLGLDAALDLGALRLRAETVWRRIQYKPGGVEVGMGNDVTSTTYLPNRVEFDGYLLAAYRTPFKIEPYVQASTNVNKAAILPRWAGEQAYTTADVATIALSAGFNVELTTHTVFKAQLVWVRAWDSDFDDKITNVPILFMRLVDSF